MTRRRGATALALLAGAVLTIAPARAAPAPAVPLEPVGVSSAAAAGRAPGVSVSVRHGERGIEVEARCRVEASAAVAWSVLTDYDGIDRFVSSIEESRITRRAADHLLVDQTAVGRLFFLGRRMRATLRVHEEAGSRIRFEDVLQRDFVFYEGEWRIEPGDGATEIRYTVTAHPRFKVPGFVLRDAFRRTIRDLVTQVADEIARREAMAGQ